MASAAHVIVRMYRIGFGDAFLLQFPAPDGFRRVLVDCGRHFQTPTKKVGTTLPPKKESDIVAQLIADVTDDEGPKIDVVIATHRHQDHVSGFSSPLWKKVTVREVWMPWTEDPDDPTAARIRRTQSSLAKQLQHDATRLGLADARFLGLVANSLSNEPAMRTLHQGFKGKPLRRFLEGKMQTLTPTVLPGVSVHVFGPARDEDIIRDMDPPAGQSYLRARRAASSGGRVTDDTGAYGARWEIAGDDAAKASPHLRVTPEMARHLDELARGDPFLVAAALEKSVNGTSLMLAFEIGDAVLFFPGDAQWGTWKRALASPKARAVLERTTFYKIGHHGSHNATPKEFVEEVLGDDFTAMASLWPIARFPRIPKKELMARLATKTKKLARADVRPTSKAFRTTDEIVETEVPIE